jgi:hypothetical protein
MKITYAHAISNPWIPASEELAKGIKPFRLTEVSAELKSHYDGEEWIAFAVVDGEELPCGCAKDEQTAICDAIHNAEWTLMDRSRQPWTIASELAT